MIAIADQALGRQIADAIAKTVFTRQQGETVVVSLPVAYPSGAFAGVHVTVSGDRCFVSDAAIGLREAEMAGVSEFFDTAAKGAADWFGVGYDGASIFAASAPLSRIEGAVTAVANASARAVAHALLIASEAKERGRNGALFELIRDIFGAKNVTKRESLAGKEATWPAHNVVLIKGRRAVFEFVSANTNSIASKFLMFSDLGRSDTPPSMNSVVDDVTNIGPKGVMLNDVSNLIQFDADRGRFIRLAEAA